jgi:hypothetical protein
MKYSIQDSLRSCSDLRWKNLSKKGEKFESEVLKVLKILKEESFKNVCQEL